MPEAERKPFAFHDLRASQYPLTLVARRVSNDEEVWRATIPAPGALEVPALGELLGEPVWVESIDGEGNREVGGPPGWEERC